VTPWVQRLLIANVIIYFIQQTVGAGLTSELAFVPALILSRPWTIITYMFLHGGLTHILFNMIALYFFGPRVESRLGTERFFALYFISGISGALLSFLFKPYNPIIGASAAIFGVMIAFARFWPRDRIMIWGIIPIEARWLIIITTVMAIVGGVQGGSGVADFAHLGGYLGGFLYLLFLERTQGAKRFKKQATAGPPPDALQGNWQKVDRKAVHAVNRDEVNRILDKISASGLKSLTPQERLFLSNFVPMDDRPKSIPPS
jgi:membrane associated rhomboid family serine protease